MKNDSILEECMEKSNEHTIHTNECSNESNKLPIDLLPKKKRIPIELNENGSWIVHSIEEIKTAEIEALKIYTSRISYDEYISKMNKNRGYNLDLIKEYLNKMLKSRNQRK